MIIPFKKAPNEPFFLRHALVCMLLTLIGCTLSYLFFDIPIALFFHTLKSPLKELSLLISNVIHPQTNYFIWPLLFFGVKLWRKKEALSHNLLLFIISIPLANLLINFLKWLCGRARPDLLFSNERFGFFWFQHSDLYLSFPSGHGCTVGAIFGLLACFYPKKSLLFFCVALLLAFTRVILTDHYLSDILMGVMLGTLVAQGVYALKRRARI